MCVFLGMHSMKNRLETVQINSKKISKVAKLRARMSALELENVKLKERVAELEDGIKMMLGNLTKMSERLEEH